MSESGKDNSRPDDMHPYSQGASATTDAADLHPSTAPVIERVAGPSFDAPVIERVGGPLPGAPANGGMPPNGGTGTPANDGSSPGGPVPPTPPVYETFAVKDGERRPLFTFGGNGLDFFVLKLQNTLLTILTLGIYHFWGKARVRGYLWQETKFFGEPLEYTGTGKELFISFLIVMPVFILFMAGMGIMSQFLPGIGQLIFLILFLFLWQYASYRALRYRLTRTRWRGIRGNLAGKPSGYAWKAFGCLLLCIISAGLLVPFAISRIIALKMNNIYFGDRRLGFDGTAGGLYRTVLAPFIVMLGLYFILIGGLAAFILTAVNNPGTVTFDPQDPFFALAFMGVIYGTAFMMMIVDCWLQAAVLRWICRHTRLGNMRVESVLTGGKLLKVTLVNLLLVVFTFGIGLPWAQIRMYRAVLNSIDYTGDPGIDSLGRNTAEAPKFGEGLLEALDVDVAF